MENKPNYIHATNIAKLFAKWPGKWNSKNKVNSTKMGLWQILKYFSNWNYFALKQNLSHSVI